MGSLSVYHDLLLFGVDEYRVLFFAGKLVHCVHRNHLCFEPHVVLELEALAREGFAHANDECAWVQSLSVVRGGVAVPAASALGVFCAGLADAGFDFGVRVDCDAEAARTGGRGEEAEAAVVPDFVVSLDAVVLVDLD